MAQKVVRNKDITYHRYGEVLVPIWVKCLLLGLRLEDPLSVEREHSERI